MSLACDHSVQYNARTRSPSQPGSGQVLLAILEVCTRFLLICWQEGQGAKCASVNPVDCMQVQLHHL
eukprot:1137260-Pelagomonas_calceolata.AAC.11